MNRDFVTTTGDLDEIEEVVSLRPFSQGDVVAGDELAVRADTVTVVHGSGMTIAKSHTFSNGTVQITVKRKAS